MQPLNHAAIDLNGAARGVFRALKGGNDPACFRYFLGGRREDRIAASDLAGMDQRLAVEAEIARLRAFLAKAGDFCLNATPPIENFQAMRARR